MWKLTIEDDEGKQTALPLAHDEYGVGRAEANAIRLTDRNVSRKHAILKKNGQGWFIKDLASYNGTYVNGARVAGEQLITNGDVVQLGDYRLELLDEATIAAQQGAGSDTSPAMGVAQPLPVHHRPDRLVVVVGPTPGAEFPLDREYFTIGRAEDATISINHSSVSRLHSELIALGGGRYEIVDKQSANGIRINGVELKRGILEAGDALELGDVRMRFVGAGKIFRAGADQSQQLRAIGGFESVAPSVRAPAPMTPAGRAGIGKFVVIGAIVGVIAIVGVVAALKSSGPPPTPPPGAQPVQTDDGGQLLKEAHELFAKGDIDGAHSKLEKVVEASPARDDPAFKEIEKAWAEAQFKKAESATDPVEKRRFLSSIASTTTVDTELRKKAADALQSVDSVPEPASTKYTPPPGTYAAPPSTGAFPGTSHEPPPTPSVKASDPRPVEAPAPPGGLDNETIRRTLGPRVWAGKASEQEIRMLKSACSSLGDRACRDRAAAELKRKQGG